MDGRSKMRRRWYGLSLFLPLFLGCAGKNVVAGEEKTKAEQLESALPSWCQATCARLRACESTTPCQCADDVCNCVGVDENCETQCQSYLAPFIGAGELCANIGERMERCVDGLTCGDLGGQDPCRPTPAEKTACPDPNDPDDSPPSGGDGDLPEPVATGGTSSTAGPSVAGGTTFTAGTASTGGYYGTGGTFAGVNPVSCEGSYGAGGGAPASGGSQVTCEEGRTGCTDGHDYSWICVQDSQGQRACSCLIDAHVTAGFEPVVGCPDLSAVNAGCGWSLLP
jgi:hypothetical protein